MSLQSRPDGNARQKCSVFGVRRCSHKWHSSVVGDTPHVQRRLRLESGGIDANNPKTAILAASRASGENRMATAKPSSERPTFKSIRSLIEYVRQAGIGRVDSRQWHTEWKERWVAFVDLIAFASRSVQSRDVVLNNIIRFDRASTIARDTVPTVKVFRFSDSTFAVADDFSSVFAFAVAIHHACLAINAEFVGRVRNPLFIHTIAPRVTLAQGSVLGLPNAPRPEKRFDGLDPNTLVAGKGIVNAYDLERRSAGGLLTTDRAGAKSFVNLTVRGGPRSTQRYIESWKKRFSKRGSRSELLFVRDDVLDIPWLLLRPTQMSDSTLWCVSRSEAAEAIYYYLKMWELGAREFNSAVGSYNQIDTAKHFAAAIRHGVNCAQARAGQYVPRYYSLDEAYSMLEGRRD